MFSDSEAADSGWSAALPVTEQTIKGMTEQYQDYLNNFMKVKLGIDTLYNYISYNTLHPAPKYTRKYSIKFKIF